MVVKKNTKVGYLKYRKFVNTISKTEWILFLSMCVATLMHSIRNQVVYVQRNRLETIITGKKIKFKKFKKTLESAIQQRRKNDETDEQPKASFQQCCQ